MHDFPRYGLLAIGAVVAALCLLFFLAGKKIDAEADMCGAAGGVYFYSRSGSICIDKTHVIDIERIGDE